MNCIFRTLCCLAFGLFVLQAQCSPASAAEPFACPPTAEDEMGPFYRPNAPIRSGFGHGYLLSGRVRSADDCKPIPYARIELWMAGPDGWYSDEYRATTFADRKGRYRFEGPYPGFYASRPPHIHMRVSTRHFQPLVTQHYPQPKTSIGHFDLVLRPGVAPNRQRRQILHSDH